MSKIRRWLAILGVALSGVTGAADVTPGFGASLRLGYGAPMGMAMGGGAGMDLGDAFSRQVPVQVDLGYRVTPQLVLAVYGQYAFTYPASATGCGQGGVSCSASTIRAGVETFWHFLPGHALDPWVGGGVGYEWSSWSVEAHGASADVQLRGFEYCNAQVGADFAVTPTLSVGPFAQLTFGEYATIHGSTGGSSTSLDLLPRAHEWLQLGVRGTFNL